MIAVATSQHGVCRIYRDGQLVEEVDPTTRVRTRPRGAVREVLGVMGAPWEPQRAPVDEVWAACKRAQKGP